MMSANIISAEKPEFFYQVYLGENLDQTYSGPLTMGQKFLPEKVRYQSLDDEFYNSFWTESLGHMYSLYDFSENEFSPNAQCAHGELNKNINYI